MKYSLLPCARPEIMELLKPNSGFGGWIRLARLLSADIQIDETQPSFQPLQDLVESRLCTCDSKLDDLSITGIYGTTPPFLDRFLPP
ncbi:hypothetical protein E2542_SST22085 [Spatholobus suberectus]|nr:hypothetical protein E2542_SST22085 [Spatholobus suberectus]